MILVEQADTSREREVPEKERVNYEDITPEMRLQQAQQPAVVRQTATQAQTPVIKPVNSFQRIREIMATSMPKPVYDPNRPEELKRVARATALAKGLNLVGDLVGVKEGANIVRRQPDNKELAYLDNAYQYIDNYTRRIDDWNYKDFINKLRGAELGLQQENIAADNARRDRMAQQQAQQFSDEWKNRKELADMEAQNRLTQAEKEQEYAMARIMEQNKGNLKEAYVRSSRGNNEKNNEFEIETRSGKVHKLSPRKASLYVDLAIENYKKLAEVRPELFNIEVNEHGKPTGNVTFTKQATEENLIRAMLELEERQQAEKYEDPKNRPAYPGAPLREGEKLPDQSKYPTQKQTASKPKTVRQNGITYTLNETTGEYE